MGLPILFWYSSTSFFCFSFISSIFYANTNMIKNTLINHTFCSDEFFLFLCLSLFGLEEHLVLAPQLIDLLHPHLYLHQVLPLVLLHLHLLLIVLFLQQLIVLLQLVDLFLHPTHQYYSLNVFLLYFLGRLIQVYFQVHCLLHYNCFSNFIF